MLKWQRLRVRFYFKLSSSESQIQIFQGEVKMTPPFRVTFNEQKDEKKPSLFVESVVKINRGPYPFNEPKRNNIPFTPTQV